MTSRERLETGGSMGRDGDWRHDPQSPARKTVELVVTERTAGAAVILSVAGNLDMAAAPPLAQRVGVVLGRRPEVFIVDLTDVNFLTTAGMSILIEADRQSREHGRSFRLVATGALTLRPMQLLGIDEMLDIYDSVDAAIAGEPSPQVDDE